MKQLSYIILLTIVFFQSSCTIYKYKKEIYRSDSSIDKETKINSLKIGDKVKIGLKNGDKLRVRIIMLNEKEVYGSTEAFGNLWDKIIKFEEIEYVKLGEEDYLIMIGVPILFVGVLIYGGISDLNKNGL